MITILIADDDPVVREGLKLILSSQQDICVSGEASDGNMALKLCREQHVDVALLDIRMSGCDGITVAEAVFKFR